MARYRLMGAAMAADGVPVLLTAHHRNDQAETVLMRLAHGSGIEGLRGMARWPMSRACWCIGLLLDCDPEDLRAVVDAAGLVPAEDPSNSDAHYERVRWRQALPELAELGLDAETLMRFCPAHGGGRRGDRADGRELLCQHGAARRVRFGQAGAPGVCEP